MKMTDVDARLAELESRRIAPGLSVAEQNELRDCEITLGMVEAPPRARAEAARRVERFAAERAAKKTPAQLQREIDEALAQKHRPRSHAEKKKSLGALDGTRITVRHSTKSASELMVTQMIGRRVKSGWHGLADGEIIQWEPFGAGSTDVLVKDSSSGHLSWYASHGLTPIDGRGPLPSRAEVRKIRDAEMKVSMKKIAERWAKEPPPPRIRR